MYWRGIFVKVSRKLGRLACASGHAVVRIMMDAFPIMRGGSSGRWPFLPGDLPSDARKFRFNWRLRLPMQASRGWKKAGVP